jgi:hypothetical protein
LFLECSAYLEGFVTLPHQCITEFVDYVFHSSVLANHKDMHFSRSLLSSSQLDPHTHFAISCVTDASNLLRFSPLVIYFIPWKLFPVCWTLYCPMQNWIIFWSEQLSSSLIFHSWTSFSSLLLLIV